MGATFYYFNFFPQTNRQEFRSEPPGPINSSQPMTCSWVYISFYHSQSVFLPSDRISFHFFPCLSSFLYLFPSLLFSFSSFSVLGIRVSNSSGYLPVHYIAEVDLELLSHLLPPLEYWTYRHSLYGAGNQTQTLMRLGKVYHLSYIQPFI